DDGDLECSYLGINDSADGTGANANEGLLMPGTYTIAVALLDQDATAPYYILDVFMTPASVTPIAGDLKINEYMGNDGPADTNCDGMAMTGSETSDEFVELVNTSNFILDLTGVTIADNNSVRHTFAPAATGSMFLAPGKAVVVWGGGTPNCAGVTNFFTAS